MNETSDGLRCFFIILITTTVVVISDLIARAFFYEEAKNITSFLPLLIGSIALCVMGITKGKRNKPQLPANEPNTSEIRRVRVTGPVK